MTTLISLLGKSHLDKDTGYRKTRYRFDDKVREAPYFALALLDYVKPDKLILAGTSGSMWDVFFDQQQTGDEAVLQLVDAVAQNTVTDNMLAIHQQRLTEKLGMQVRCLLISYGRNEDEQAAILRQLADVTEVGERIVLDVTHGYRHLPMLALVAARYLAHVRSVQVQELYYGALQMTDAQSGEAPVLRLGGMLRMLDWVEALAVYEHSGNYGMFGELLRADGMNEDHAAQIARGAYFERSNNPVQARQALGTAFASLQEHEGALGTLFKSTLSEQIGWHRRGNRADWELALADRYLARQDHVRAIAFMYEGFVSAATLSDPFADVNNFDDRKAALDHMRKSTDFRLLAYLRNAMMHGVRPSDEHGNKTARETRRLLDDQRALDEKLRQLRKTLFPDTSR